MILLQERDFVFIYIEFWEKVKKGRVNREEKQCGNRRMEREVT